MSTGLRQVDLQHQELIDMINALEAALAGGRREHALATLLPQLNAYVLFHFGTEDAYIEQAGGRHALAHQQQHREFTERVAAWRAQPAAQLDLDVLLAYLQRWLVEHILKTDRELARLIQVQRGER